MIREPYKRHLGALLTGMSRFIVRRMLLAIPVVSAVFSPSWNLKILKLRWQRWFKPVN